MISRNQRRWDTDEIGHGIADGSSLRPDVERLLETLAISDWVAENPEEHLLPHLERACAAPESPWQLLIAEMDAAAVYQVTLLWERSGANLRRLRADAFSLIGEIAESVSYVCQHIAGDTVIYDICTGMRDGDSPFRPHGHLIRFTIKPGNAATGRHDTQ